MNPLEKSAPPAWSPESGSQTAGIAVEAQQPNGKAVQGWSGLDSREAQSPLDRIIHDLNGVAHNIRLLAHSLESSEGTDASVQAEFPSLMRRSVDRMAECVERLRAMRNHTQ